MFQQNADLGPTARIYDSSRSQMRGSPRDMVLRVVLACGLPVMLFASMEALPAAIAFAALTVLVLFVQARSNVSRSPLR